MARSRRRRGGRGVEEGAALRGLGSPLRHEALLVLRRHPGVAPWLPHVRLSDGKRGLRHEFAPTRLTRSPGWVTGQYLDGVRLENRWIFLVSSETHFPLSVFVRKTGFRLLSSRNRQPRLRFKSKNTIPPLVEEQEADTPPSLAPLFPVIDLSIPFCY